MTILDLKHKEDTVGLFFRNLLWGNISIDYEEFKRKEKGEQLASILHKKLRDFHEYDLCPNDDGSPPEPTDWLFDFFFEGRVYGAIKGEFRDKTFEQRIWELEQENERLKKDNTEIKSQRDLAIAELAHLKTSEPPVKKDIKAYD